MKIPRQYWNLDFDPNQVVINEYIDDSSIKIVGTVTTFTILGEINPKRVAETIARNGTRSYLTVSRMDCGSPYFMTISHRAYSGIGGTGSIVMEAKVSGEWSRVSFVNEGMYKFICRKDPDIRPKYQSQPQYESQSQYEPPSKYTSQQREAMQNMLRELERQQLLDDIDDKINRGR